MQPASPTRRPLHYVVTIETRLCGHAEHVREFGKFNKLENAVKVIGGYWAVYLGFFGDQQVWLDFKVVDMRNGRLVWHNGQHLNTSEGTIDGNTQGTEGAAGHGGSAH